MKGRARAHIRRVVGFVVGTFLCVLLTASSGAWAQRVQGSDSDIQAEKNPSSESQPLSKQRNNAFATGNEDGSLWRDYANSPDKSPQDNRSRPSEDSSFSAVGERFYADISVGGVPTSCCFEYLNAAEVQIVARSIDDAAVKYTPAIDPKATGELVIPSSVADPEGTSYVVSAVGDDAFRHCEHILTTGLSGQKSITRLGAFAYCDCVELQDTGFESNDKITTIGAYDFLSCSSLACTGLAHNETVTEVSEGAFQETALATTGLDTNTTITQLGKCAFYGCQNLTSTGLASNTHISSLHQGTFYKCTSLASTGLEGNTSIDKMDDFVFAYDSSLTSTGLKNNTKIKCIDVGDFMNCTSLASTDLAECSSVVVVNALAFQDCTRLTSTGLEGNTTLNTLGERAFANCTALLSSGLAVNYTVSSLGKMAFYHCIKLGTQDTANENRGDLVLNAPSNGGKLSLEDCVFCSTGYQELFLPTAEDRLSLSSQAFGDYTDEKGEVHPTTLSKLFVPSSWCSPESWSGGGKSFAISDGSLINMVPLQHLSAARNEGYSDSALVNFTVNQSFKAHITNQTGKALGEYEVRADDSKPLDEVSVSIPSGSALSPSEEKLQVSVTPLDGSSTKFAYPAGAKSQTYNLAEGNSGSCALAPISYTIHFDTNGGVGSMADMQNVRYDSANTLSSKPSDFSRENCRFNHWSTLQDDRDAHGQINLVRNDGAAIDNLSDIQGALVTLYAQWDIGLVVLSFDKAKSADTGALQGVGYTLSTSAQDPSAFVEGLSEDVEEHDHIDRWPIVSNSGGNISLYYLSKGTYYLFNSLAAAGFSTFDEPKTILISEEGGRIITTLDGIELQDQNTSPARISIAFGKVGNLPTTGNAPAALLQGLGVFMLVLIAVAALRRLRHSRAR